MQLLVEIKIAQNKQSMKYYTHTYISIFVCTCVFVRVRYYLYRSWIFVNLLGKFVCLFSF